MVQMRTCSFCGNNVEPGTGKMFVKKDGTIFFFCGMKCQKNMLLMGRIPRRVVWTETYMRAKHGAIEAEEEVKVEEAPAEEAPEVAEVEPEFAISAPKGKDIPQAVVALIDKRFGPELPASQIDTNFKEFTASATLRHTVGLWYKKKHPGKKLTEVPTSEYVAFLDTTQAKKILKDWLDEKAKKEK